MARSSVVEIRDEVFRHRAKPSLGFEVFRLSRLHRAQAFELPRRAAYHTIYVGLRGAGRLLVDFQPVVVGTNHLTFVPSGRVQQLVPDPAVDAWVLMFTPEFMLSGASSPDPLATAATLSPPWGRAALAIPPREMRELIELAEQLHAEHARPLDQLQPWILMGLLRSLVLHAERRVDRATPIHAALRRFLAILERDHTAVRSVDHYARHVGISARRLAELVHAHTGKSTKQVIADRVVLEQKRLLAYTELSVKELAARTGFGEPTNLVKFFRRHVGITPLEFRGRHHR